MNVLWCDEAVGRMASTASTMRCSAESVPIVMSVPQKSLSMDPTMPTTFRWEHAARCEGRGSLINHDVDHDLCHVIIIICNSNSNSTSLHERLQ